MFIEKYQALPNSALMFILQKTYFQLHHNFDIVFSLTDIGKDTECDHMQVFLIIQFYIQVFSLLKKMEHSLYFERR